MGVRVRGEVRFIEVTGHYGGVGAVSGELGVMRLSELSIGVMWYWGGYWGSLYGGWGCIQSWRLLGICKPLRRC